MTIQLKEFIEIIKQQDTVLSFLYNEMIKPVNVNSILEHVNTDYFASEAKFSPNYTPETLATNLCEDINSSLALQIMVSVIAKNTTLSLLFIIDIEGYNEYSQLNDFEYYKSKLKSTDKSVCKVVCFNANKPMFETDLLKLGFN